MNNVEMNVQAVEYCFSILVGNETILNLKPFTILVNFIQLTLPFSY